MNQKQLNSGVTQWRTNVMENAPPLEIKLGSIA